MVVKLWSYLGKQTCSARLFFLPRPAPSLEPPESRGEGAEVGLHRLNWAPYRPRWDPNCNVHQDHPGCELNRRTPD